MMSWWNLWRRWTSSHYATRRVGHSHGYLKYFLIYYLFHLEHTYHCVEGFRANCCLAEIVLKYTYTFWGQRLRLLEGVIGRPRRGRMLRKQFSASSTTNESCYDLYGPRVAFSDPPESYSHFTIIFSGALNRRVLTVVLLGGCAASRVPLCVGGDYRYGSVS